LKGGKKDGVACVRPVLLLWRKWKKKSWFCVKATKKKNYKKKVLRRSCFTRPAITCSAFFPILLVVSFFHFTCLYVMGWHEQYCATLFLSFKKKKKKNSRILKLFCGKKISSRAHFRKPKWTRHFTKTKTITWSLGLAEICLVLHKGYSH
jgi:hypothetical protein